jgi:translation elongation factor EF-Tu-like GTPase
VDHLPIAFTAIIQFRTTKEGGRSGPAKSGYRPQIKFAFTKYQTSGQQNFIGKDIVEPGDLVNAEIRLLSPHFFNFSLSEGMEFEVREGHKIVATGKILQILNDKLKVKKT